MLRQQYPHENGQKIIIPPLGWVIFQSSHGQKTGVICESIQDPKSMAWGRMSQIFLESDIYIYIGWELWSICADMHFLKTLIYTMLTWHACSGTYQKKHYFHVTCQVSPATCKEITILIVLIDSVYIYIYHYKATIVFFVFFVCRLVHEHATEYVLDNVYIYKLTHGYVYIQVSHIYIVCFMLLFWMYTVIWLYTLHFCISEYE